MNGFYPVDYNFLLVITLDIDRESGSGNSYGFAPATGNLMYCMPQVGTRTALYLGNAEEAEGILTGCIRTNGNTCEGMEKPENKGFLSEHGKGLSLYPESMGLTGKGAGMICLEDEGGAILESEGSLILMAKEGIRLEGMSGIALSGMSGIMALHDGGVSSLCINGSIDLLGGSTGLGACVYQSFPPYDDAPKEGEFDWGGFWRNIVIGVGVGIACIGLSCIPVLGPIASGALLGAGIGALSATVTRAISDYSSGNVRSVKETIRDVTIASGSGAVTGAVTVVGLPLKISEKIVKATGANIPMLKQLVEGGIDTALGIGGRGARAALDKEMTTEEKLAYVFDLKQIGADFITGIVIGEAVDRVVPGIKNKFPDKSLEIRGDADVPKAFQQKKFKSFYEERIGQTPGEKNKLVEFQNKELRGESKCTLKPPPDTELQKILDEAGIDGIEYRNGVPDFSPVSKLELEGIDMTNGRTGAKGTYTQANNRVAEMLNNSPELVAEFGISPKNGKRFTVL